MTELPINLLPPGFERTGKSNRRTSIRGVARRDGNFLLVHLAASGTWEFPGGGVEEGETHAETLAREFLEETGYRVDAVGPCWLKIVETSIDKFDSEAVFEVSSFFYECSVGSEQVELSQEAYEIEEGSVPVWGDLDTAIDANERYIKNFGETIPSWINRTQKAFLVAREKYAIRRSP